jgi:ABC-2 type transport system permease protein
MPTLLRVGMAEAMAYRAEFIVWMLTTTLPLVMLGLWTTVASEGRFQGFGPEQFTAYYLAALIVRNLTGSWVVWQINSEVRDGGLSMRLLRPVHPFVTLSATHLAAIPLRAMIALPVGLILLLTTRAGTVEDDPAVLAVLVVAIVGAWLLTFFWLVMIGALSFFIEKSMAVFEVYLGVFAVLSGYLIPLALMPGWVGDLAGWLPFRYMLGFPVELLIGSFDRAGALRGLAIQWAFVAAVFAAALAVWRAGVRRYEAYGQ